ncbi:MAG: hypothetical protein M3Y71_14790 [Actinomycetota bacterium]|nr:hypothetical protein [Actinomycetota bacterium]
MSDTATRFDTTPTTRTLGARGTLYTVVAVLAGVAVVLQGVWAGLLVREGEGYRDTWVQVHDLGAKVCIALALAALVVAVATLRSRRDLIIGSAVFLVLLAIEGHLGSLIGDSPAVTAIHFPLAMALTGLAVWLPFRSRHA